MTHLGTMSLLLAIAADLRLTIWAIAREVTHLAAILALDVAEVARLGALLGHVVLRAAVAASLLARLALLGAVTSTVTLLGAVGTGDDDASRL